MKNMLFGMLMFLASFNLFAKGALENPKQDSVQSGIGIVSGWYCDAKKIEIVFDNRPPKEAAYGTTRGDTEGACGDDNNGFGLQWAWSILGKGWHTVRAYADGKLFAERDFYVGQIGDGSYLRGAEGSFELNGFPDEDTEVVVTWNESTQNFSILESRKNTPSGGSDWSGIWSTISAEDVWISTNDGYVNGKHTMYATMGHFSTGIFEIYKGEIRGNKVRLYGTSYTYVDAVFDVTLLTPNKAKVYVVKCKPDIYECRFPAGVTFTIDRVL